MGKFWNGFKNVIGLGENNRNGKFDWTDLLNHNGLFDWITDGATGKAAEKTETWLKNSIDNVGGIISGENQRENQALEQAALAEQQKYNTTSAQAAMDFSAEQAQIAREWDLQVNSPSFKMQQLKEAGINPVLGLGMLGSNYTSSSPQGVMASSSTAEVDTKNQLLELGSLIGAGMFAISLFRGKAAAPLVKAATKQLVW